MSGSKAPSPAMPGRDLKKADAGGVRVLMADMSLGVWWASGRCPLFDARRFTQPSYSRSLDRDKKLLDWSVCFSWEFNCLEKPAAVRKSFTDFQNAARSNTQYSGQSRADYSVSLAVPKLVCDCVLSLAGLRFVLVIWLIRSRAWDVTRLEYWWLVAKKSDMWNAWVTRSLGGGGASLSFVVYKKRKRKNSKRDSEKGEAR